MNEFENIQRLLRLKRYETPGDDFVEDFVTLFRERQRAELLRHSARGLLWERVNTFFSDLVSPKWATASATAAFAVAAAWGTLNILGQGSAQGPQMALTTDALPAILQKQPTLAVDSELIKKAGMDQNVRLEGILLSRHFEGDSPEVAASNSGYFMPTSAEMLPVIPHQY